MVRAATAAVILSLTVGLSACRAQSPYLPVEHPRPGDTVCGAAVCGAEFLTPAFLKLEASGRPGAGRIHILQIGDSHTAGDQISGQVRSRLQARFGRGGRGILPAGLPYVGYAPRQLSVATTGARYLPAPLIAGGTRVSMGLAGGQGRLETGAHLSLTLDPGVPLTAIGVCGQAGPDRGTLQIVPDIGLPQAIDFRRETAGPLCAAADLSSGDVGLTLVAVDAPVVLDDVRLWGEGGLSLSNLGVVGSTLMDLEGRDAATVEAQLRSDPPDLILLAYGTNEGFDDDLDPAAYEQVLRGRITWLRRVAPDATLMILGAPDGLRRRQPTPGPERWSQSCGSERDWQTPRALALVRDVQRRVSEDLGVAFWDWYGRMGGACSADRLAGGTEPLMRGDRVHFTAVGAEWIGDILADDLLTTYDGWRAGRTGGD
ncbi:GDSL-type esterase/lipase family protein [Brevundimonas sp.]|uniref:GDSL-type esterase/lipase family protein n=1 Tax=Brevundimonas sp. TaxID=1871086 RepID=UPI003AF66B3B